MPHWLLVTAHLIIVTNPLSSIIVPVTPGLYDSSGIRVYYTSQLRKYDVGVLQLGFFTFPIHFIPPGAESFMSYGLCKTEKFEEVKLGAHPPRSSLLPIIGPSDPKVTQPGSQSWRIA